MTQDEQSMALCAIRYTIGRRTYIVSSGQRWAIEWGSKSKWVRDVILRDLEFDLERCDAGYHILGDPPDENGWREVYRKLKELKDEEEKFSS